MGSMIMVCIIKKIKVYIVFIIIFSIGFTHIALAIDSKKDRYSQYYKNLIPRLDNEELLRNKDQYKDLLFGEHLNPSYLSPFIEARVLDYIRTLGWDTTNPKKTIRLGADLNKIFDIPGGTPDALYATLIYVDEGGAGGNASSKAWIIITYPQPDFVRFFYDSVMFEIFDKITKKDMDLKKEFFVSADLSSPFSFDKLPRIVEDIAFEGGYLIVHWLDRGPNDLHNSPSIKKTFKVELDESGWNLHGSPSFF